MDYKNVIKNFCHNVHLLRLAQRLTEDQMADIMDISVDELKRIENINPTEEILCGTLCRVCSYFHISSDAILNENWLDLLN